MQNPILKVSQLTKRYSANNSGISEISFSVNAGEVVAIIGESGSGKSTLLKSIFGLITPDSGNITFEDTHVKGPNEQLVPGHPDMRMVTQDFSLNIYANVHDNIASMLSNKNIKEKEEKTNAIMTQLRIGHLRDQKAIHLSGGEQQRVAIAKAMVAGIKLLLLDEPFSQVDTILKSELRSDLKRLASETQMTIILVSHDPSDGLYLANRVLLLKDGKVVQEGAPADVYNSPETIYAAKLLGNANILSAEDAKMLQLKSSTGIMFYPEWVHINNGWSSRSYRIEEINFKGFYEELLLERKGVFIRAIHTKCGLYKKNDSVQVNISRFLNMSDTN